MAQKKTPRLAPTGEVSVDAQGPPLVAPQGIAHSGDGAYVVVDPQAGAVFRVSSDGQVEKLAAISPR